MAINSYRDIEGGWLDKYISVGQLRECLSTLEEADRLFPNAVGNLSIIRGERQIGFIDIASEEMTLY